MPEENAQYTVAEGVRIITGAIKAACTWSVTSDPMSPLHNFQMGIVSAKADIEWNRIETQSGVLVALMEFPYGLRARIRKLTVVDGVPDLEREEIVELKGVIPLDSLTYGMETKEGRMLIGKMVCTSSEEVMNSQCLFAVSKQRPYEGAIHQDFIAGFYEDKSGAVNLKGMRLKKNALVRTCESLDSCGRLFMAEIWVDGLPEEAYVTTCIMVK